MVVRAIPFLLVVSAPFVVWLLLYLASHWWSADLRPASSWLRVLRWLTWIAGLALMLVSLAPNHLLFSYGAAISSFSMGLSFPEDWVKRRLAPDSLKTSG
jgi:uncharacterized protein involved in cysteine biosynthesis